MHVNLPIKGTRPRLVQKRFSYTLRGINEQVKAISNHNPPLYDRWRSSVSCCGLRDSVRCGSLCCPYTRVTCLIHCDDLKWRPIWTAVQKYLNIIKNKPNLSTYFNKRRDKSRSQRSIPEIINGLYQRLSTVCTRDCQRSIPETVNGLYQRLSTVYTRDCQRSIPETVNGLYQRLSTVCTRDCQRSVPETVNGLYQRLSNSWTWERWMCPNCQNNRAKLMA
jgi:hypothetical protein